MTDESLLKQNEAEIRLVENEGDSAESADLAQTVGGENLTPVVSGDLSKGTVIGHCEILEEIGRGSMGCAYKALDRALNRIVAIKTLTRQLNEESILRFQEEARALSRLKHPHVEGETLADIIAKNHPLNPDWIVFMLGQIASALHAVHRAGILHRDLKPSNIVISSREGEVEKVKIIDFGVAFDETREQRLTRKGVTIGTPLYMSPEQISGDELSPATDLYSMGCIVYEMLEGKPPYEGTREEVLASHMRGQAPLLSKQHRNLQPLVNSALHKDPAKRPTDAVAFSAYLTQKVVASVPRMFLTMPSAFFDRTSISRKAPGREAYMPMLRMWVSLAGFGVITPIAMLCTPKPFGLIVMLFLFLFFLLNLYLAMRKVDASIAKITHRKK